MWWRGRQPSNSVWPFPGAWPKDWAIRGPGSLRLCPARAGPLQKRSSALPVLLGDDRDENCPGSVERGQAVTLPPEVPRVSPKLFSLHCCFPRVRTASAGRTLLSNAEAVSLIPRNSFASLLRVGLLCDNKIILSLKPFTFSKLGAGRSDERNNQPFGR